MFRGGETLNLPDGMVSLGQILVCVQQFAGIIDLVVYIHEESIRRVFSGIRSNLNGMNVGRRTDLFLDQFHDGTQTERIATAIAHAMPKDDRG